MDHKKGHRSRLLDQFKEHPESLKDYEILEAILFFVIPQKDTKSFAKDMLKEFGSLEKVINSGKFLTKINGIGDKTSTFFSLINHLFLSIKYNNVKDTHYNVSSPSTVVEYLKSKIGYNEVETFGLLYLDGENKIINTKELFKGTVDRVVVHMRELIKSILAESAVSIILYHNHPNFSDLSASKADIDLTKKIIKGISIIDVELLDHIIVSYSGFLSMKSEGII